MFIIFECLLFFSQYFYLMTLNANLKSTAVMLITKKNIILLL